jgi:hypothetical protein
MRPQGLVTVTRILDVGGKEIPLQRAVDYGWIHGAQRAPPGWGIGREEISLGRNLFLDQGRQLICFCLGFRNPISDYTLQKFGVGTGITAANVTDISLEAPIQLASQSDATTAPIDSIDFLTPFVLRVAYTIAYGDANGYLIRERGLFSGNSTMIARHVSAAGINKTSDFSPMLTWRLRF